MKIFIAGIMQGNKKDLAIHDQDYRVIISEKLRALDKDVEVVDPDVTDPNRLSYNFDQSADMFFKYCKIASEVDLMIAYIPEASMGSAIEMWQAYNANIPVYTISPLHHNWVVKLLSKKVYKDLDDFIDNFNEI